PTRDSSISLIPLPPIRDPLPAPAPRPAARRAGGGGGEGGGEARLQPVAERNGGARCARNPHRYELSHDLDRAFLRRRATRPVATSGGVGVGVASVPVPA